MIMIALVSGGSVLAGNPPPKEYAIVTYSLEGKATVVYHNSLTKAETRRFTREMSTYELHNQIKIADWKVKTAKARYDKALANVAKAKIVTPGLIKERDTAKRDMETYKGTSSKYTTLFNKKTAPSGKPVVKTKTTKDGKVVKTTAKQKPAKPLVTPKAAEDKATLAKNLPASTTTVQTADVGAKTGTISGSEAAKTTNP